MSNHQTISDPRIADLCKALSSPHRVQILLRLVECCGSACATDDEFAACVGTLAEGLGVSASTVSHHIKELRHAGLIQCRRNGQRVECCVDLEALRTIHEFTTHLYERAVQPSGGACGEQGS